MLLIITDGGQAEILVAEEVHTVVEPITNVRILDAPEMRQHRGMRGDGAVLSLALSVSLSLSLRARRSWRGERAEEHEGQSLGTRQALRKLDGKTCCAQQARHRTAGPSSGTSPRAAVAPVLR